jgi:hypothetical protein
MEGLNREFVIYPLSSRMKALGFDEPCLAWFVSEEHGLEIGVVVKSDLIKEGILAPTWQSAFRWFREEYRLDSCIRSDYSWNITGGIWSRYDWDSEKYVTYGEAELACLNRLVEIVESKVE